jgi:NTE family protein
MREAWAGVLVAICLVATPSRAEDPAKAPPPHRPKVALVLSGGGARGSAHLGVMKVLEENHVPVDLIVGTSMGSIMGGLYAAGWSSEDLQAKILAIDWGSVFVDRLPRNDKSFRRKEEDSRFLIPIRMRFKHWKPYLPPAVIGGQNLELLFQGLAMEATGETDFDLFPIPYRAVATDLANGRAVVLGSGSLSTAMRASMSLPGIFPPVELDGKPLADGGMAANFPIRIARALGADIIIGVDITTPLRKKEQLGNLLTRVDQVTGLLTNANKEADMAAVLPQDIIIVPDLSDITFSDFAKTKITIEKGYVAAQAAAPRLRKLAVSDAEWNAYMARHQRRLEASLVVTKVEIQNTGPLDDAIVDQRINVPLGKPLDEDALADQIIRLYGLDVYGPIHHEFTRADDQGVLAIQVPPKPYGRNSLQFGFFIANDFKGDLDVDLTVSHLLLPTNRMGGEWRNTVQFGTNSVLDTEYYQPLDPSLKWVFDSRLRYRRSQVNIFSPDGDALAEYTFNTFDALTGFGRIFGNWGELIVGPYYATGSGNPRIGAAAFSAVNSDDGGIAVAFLSDTLDSTTWPRHGLFATAEYRKSLTSFGAQAPGAFARAKFSQAMTTGKNTVFLSIEASDIVSGDPVLDNLYTLGGFLRLTGLHENQLVGERGGLARFMYYRELTTFNLGSMTQRMYAGFSLETGNVYNPGDAITWPSLRVSGSIFVGADTVLGPAYLGYGYDDGGQESAYIVIGRRF